MPATTRLDPGNAVVLTLVFDPTDEPDFRGELVVISAANSSLSSKASTPAARPSAAAISECWSIHRPRCRRPPPARGGKPHCDGRATEPTDSWRVDLGMINFNKRHPLVFTLTVASVSLIVGVAAVGGWGWQRFGSVRAGVGLLQGESLLLSPRHRNLGRVGPGEDMLIKLRADNLTGHIVTINGVYGFCGSGGCVGVEDRMPVEIGPWGSRELVIRIRAPEQAGSKLRIATDVFTSVGTREVSFSGTTRGEVPGEVGGAFPTWKS